MKGQPKKLHHVETHVVAGSLCGQETQEPSWLGVWKSTDKGWRLTRRGQRSRNKKPSLRWNGQWREGGRKTGQFLAPSPPQNGTRWVAITDYILWASDPTCCWALFHPSSRLQTYRDLQMHALEVLDVPGARFSDIPEVSYIQWSP